MEIFKTDIKLTSKKMKELDIFIRVIWCYIKVY